METIDKTVITVKAGINAPLEFVWKCWTSPGDIIHWNNASEDWHTPRAENDLRTGGKFNSRMEAKDGSFGFDFWGEYTKIIPYKLIEYTLGDDRKVKIVFSVADNETFVVETFEAESTNPVEMQRNGRQSILNNFKKYVESQNR